MNWTLLFLTLLGLVQAATLKTVSTHKHTSLSSKKQEPKPAVLAAADADAEDDDDADDDDEPETKDNKSMINNQPPPVPVVVPAPVAPVPVAPAAPAVTPATGPVPQFPEPQKPVLPEHHSWDELQGHLDEVQTRQAQLKSELRLWADHSGWDQKIDLDRAALSKETTAALADMLSDIRTELHQLAVPVYTDVLYDNLSALQEKELYLKEKIEEMKAKDQAKDAPAAPVMKTEAASLPAPREGTMFMDAMYLLFGVGFGVIAVILLRSFTGN